MKTLLIDDSSTMRALQRGVVSEMGAGDIIETASAEDALEVFAQMDPDLVLVDRSLPGVDGPAFIRAIRARGSTATVIVVAAETHPEAVVESINAGATTYIAKPFTPDLLCQCITDALGDAPDTSRS